MGPLVRLVLMAIMLVTVSFAVAGPTSITLVSYNIHVGVPMGQEIGPYKSTSEDLDKLAAVIEESAACIVALQEVDCEYGLSLPHRRRSSLLNQARYLAAAENYYYVFGSAQDDTGYPTDNSRYVEWGNADLWTNNGAEHGEVGNALLTRFPLAGTPENIPLPKDDGQERRACIRAVIDLGVRSGGTSVTAVIYATHLQHNNPDTRRKQMQAIIERINSEPEGTLVFLLGDMNHEFVENEPGNPIRMARDAGLHDLSVSEANEQAGQLSTYPADSPSVRIDYIFSNQPLKVLERRVINSLASDHLPVLVSIELPL